MFIRSQSRHFQQLGVTPMWKRGQTHKDLKDTNGVVGNLFGSLPDVNQYLRFALTRDHVSKFEEQGWCVSPKPILSKPQLDMILNEVNQLVSYDDDEAPPNKNLLYSCTEVNPIGKQQIFYSTGHWRVSRSLHDLIYLPSITIGACQLLKNRPVQFLHDELFCKPPRKGSCVVWHQNAVQWKSITKPLQHLTVHIALDKHTEENGGLKVISGSHKWRTDGELFPMASSQDEDPKVHMEAIQAVLTEKEKENFRSSITLPTVPLGHALFIHPLLLHGSNPNASESWRRSAVLHYCAAGTMSAITGPLFQGTHMMRAGEILKGEFYPIVFTPPDQHLLPT
eukprot:PhF_6_TR25815/c0_g1_i1/m.36441